MNIPSKIQHLSSFEIEKLCHLLECDQQELVEFEKLALQIADETEYTYDAMMKILQKGHNLREAIFIAMIICEKSVCILYNYNVKKLYKNTVLSDCITKS